MRGCANAAPAVRAPDIELWLADTPERSNPIGQQVGRSGSAIIRRAGSEIQVSGPRSLDGRVDLDRCQGWVWSPADDQEGPWVVVHGHLRILWSLALARRGLHWLHAAAVVRSDAGAILIVGPSGAGKSTLAARLVGAGATLLSDDTVFVDETTGEVFGMGDPCRLLDPTESGHRPTGQDPDGKMTVDTGQTTIGPARPRLILFLDTTSGGQIRCNRLTPADAMANLLQSGWSGLDPQSGAGCLRAFGRLAESCAAIRVTRGPEQPPVTMLQEWLELALA